MEEEIKVKDGLFSSAEISLTVSVPYYSILLNHKDWQSEFCIRLDLWNFCLLLHVTQTLCVTALISHKSISWFSWICSCLLSWARHILEHLNTPNTPHPHIHFCGCSSPNDLTSYLILMHLLVCWVIIDLVALSLDYCRVNGRDADGDYSMISNCTRQRLQMEPYILAKEAAGLSASLQSCDYLKRLIFFSLVILNRNLKWYETQTIVGLCFQEYHFCTVWLREMCWNIIRHMETDQIQANLISSVTCRTCL